MKSFKYLLAATVFLSINTWSSETMTTSQICHLTPATKTCRELYETFLVDLLHQVETNAEGFDKHQYIDEKLASHRAELNVLENEKLSQKKQRKEPIVQATQPVWNFFSFFSFFDFFGLFWNEPEELEEPEHEEIAVGDSYDTDINDKKHQIAMYEKIQLTLPVIIYKEYNDSIVKNDEFWEIHSDDEQIDSREHLEAYSIMLKWLDVNSFFGSFSRDFAKNSVQLDYAQALSNFQNAVFISESLTKFQLDCLNLQILSPEYTDRFLKKLYSPNFANLLAQKTESKPLSPKHRPLKELSIQGIYGVNEFLENFTTINYSDWLWAYASSPGAPYLDSLEITSLKQEESLSDESLKTIEGLLINGLKELNFAVKIHQKEDQSPSRVLESMITKIYNPEKTNGETLALKKLTLSEMGQREAAVFVRSLAVSKNNLEELKLSMLHPESHNKEVLDALTEIYSNENNFNLVSSELKLKTLVYNGSYLGGNPIDPEQEQNISKFLCALANSPQAETLEAIELESINLSDKNIDDFAQAILAGQHLCPINYVSLLNNNISLEKVRVLVDAFKQVCGEKLNRLSFASKLFNTEDAKELIKEYAPYMEIDVY
jgi:hypothetical protein